jgi:hypothetical protein
MAAGLFIQLLLSRCRLQRPSLVAQEQVDLDEYRARLAKKISL